MCHQVTYQLACEHIHTKTHLCPSAPGGGRWHCRDYVQKWVPYPPPPGCDLPVCPLPECPFEAKGRRWDCCWCGKARNAVGRCSCVMIIGGAEYRCEHICCGTCQASCQ